MLPHLQSARDCALGTTIGAFGFLYFTLYAVQLFIFHFPSTVEHIPDALAVVGFGVGTALWYANHIYYHVLHTSQSDEEKEEPKTIQHGCVFLLWTATLPTIHFFFRGQILLQLWYTLTFTLVAIGKAQQRLSYAKTTEAVLSSGSLHVTLVSLLALIPTIHAYAEPTSVPSHLAVAVSFGRLMIGGILGGALYIVRPLERVGLVQDWHPSLHGAHLIWTWFLVDFSKPVLEAAIDHLH